MSRLNNQNSLNYGNKETHIFTEFGTLAKESTQKEVLDAIQNINIQVEGGTFEASDTVTHQKLDTLNTTITNKHLNSSTDNVSVSGSVTVNTISGFAVETGGNLASIKTNTDRIKSDTTNTDAIQVQVKNTTVPVSGSVTVNTISGFAVESGGNLASIKTNTDRIKSDTTNVDAIQVQVKNSSLTVDGSVSVNTITGFAVETGGNLASIKTNTDRIKSDTTNVDAIQVQVKNTTVPVSGSVSVNTISGFAVESGGNLASIKTNTDRIKSDTTNTDAIQVQVKNSSLTVDGSVSVSNQITGFATSALQTLGNALLTDIKTKTLSSNTDSVTVWAGNDDFKIRNLSSTVDNVDVGLSVYSYQNRDPPFPATRDVLSTQLVGVDNLAGDNLINILADANGNLKVNTGLDLSNLAQETTLSTIKDTTDKLQFTPTTNYLKCEIENTSLNVDTGLDLSNLATEATLGSIKQKTDDLSFSLIDTNKYLNVNVGNDLVISTLPALSYEKDSIELYAQDPTASLKSIQCDSTGHLDIVGSVTVNTITDYNLETTQVDIKNQTNKLQFTNAPDSYLKVAVQNFPSGGSTVSIKDSNGDNLLAVSASVPQLRSTLYDVSGNNIGSSETSIGSGIYALRTYNTELNSSYNPSGNALQTAPKLYNGSSYVEQKGDANGRAEININSSGTAITHTGTALDVEIKNAANIKVDVQNTSLNTHIMGYDEDTLTYKDISVDSNGFLNVNTIEGVHENIDIGFDENSEKLTKYKGTSGYMTWKAQNAYCKEQNGWYVTGDAANMAALSWYNNGDFIAGGGNPTIPFYSQYNFTKADIDIWYMIIQNYNCNSLLATFPFIYIMSKPTGSGDYAPYAHSIWVYSIDVNQFINNGSSIMIYNGNLARVKTNDVECPRISYSLINTLGAGGNNEVIGHITMETQPYPSSGVTIDLNILEGAIYVKQKGLVNYYFNNNRQNVLSGSNILTDKSSNSVTSNKLENSSYNAVGLDTKANLYASFSGSSQPISYTSTSSPNVSYSLDTYIQNSSTTNNAKDYIIGGLDVNNKIGLNVYQIFPKKLYYNMGGYSAYNVGSALMAGWGNNLSFSNLNTSNSTWYWNLDSTTTGNWVILYDYINSSGNLVANQSQTVATVNGTGTYVPIAGGVQMKGVIRWRFDTFRNVSYNLYITPSNSTSAPLGITYSVGGGNAGGQSSNLMGVMIVPNGYVAYIPQLSYVGGANMNVCLVKFTDTAGTGGTSSTRQILNKYYYVNLTSKEITAGSGGGGIGGVFAAGDRFCLMTLDATATARWSNIDVVLEAI